MTLNYCKRDLIQITPFHKKGKHYQNSRQHSRLSRSKGFQQLFNCAVLSRCDPMDSRLPGSSVHGILQARVLEWVAMPLRNIVAKTNDLALGNDFFKIISKP